MLYLFDNTSVQSLEIRRKQSLHEDFYILDTPKHE